MQSENCRTAADRVLIASPLPAPRSPLSRRGVTLIELLVVIMIIGLLAALVLGVASVAGESARERHSQHMIGRLHTLLTEYCDTFKTRRVRLNPVLEAQIDSSNLSAAEKGKAKAQARLYALRELLVTEIPDRWSDVLLNAVPTANAGTSSTPLFPLYLDSTGAGGAYGRSTVSGAFLRRYIQVAKNAVTSDQVVALTDNQGAECLYMIITMAAGDGEARTLFGENCIGDTDGDGAPEFLDGWGHPINFLRWAPGFESQIQLDANVLATSLRNVTTNNTLWTTAAAGDHDPYDMFRMDPLAFRLVPLVFSGGRDETFGIRLVKPHVTWRGVANPTVLPNSLPLLQPYALVQDPDDATQVFLGTPNSDGTATDNVHNHMLGKR
jgi:prepilin-type N-terminal cleavage/methylation domain-containing protein